MNIPIIFIPIAAKICVAFEVIYDIRSTYRYRSIVAQSQITQGLSRESTSSSSTVQSVTQIFFIC